MNNTNIWIDQERVRIARFCERLEDMLARQTCLEVVWEFILDFIRHRMDKCKITRVHNELQDFLEASFSLRSRSDFYIWTLNFEEVLTKILRIYRTGVL